MTRYKRSAVLCAFALLIAGCQCPIACASDRVEKTEAASTQAPPCHRHHSKDDAKAPACTHSIIVAEERAAAVSSSIGTLAPIGPWTLVEPEKFVAPIHREIAIVHITSPPGNTAPFLRSTVLRI